jgi:hypothetical protein
MAIKFSQLPRLSSVDNNSLIPVVNVGISSNILGVATGTTLGSFVVNTMSSNLAAINSNISDIQSNASAQQTSINSLISGQSSQGSSISTIQGQIVSLQSNAATQDAQISAVATAVLGGAVNSLLVTAPIIKSGNATYPNISLPVATTSANGYLSSTDWTTFNNKAPTANPTFTGTAIVATLNTGNIAPTANAVSNIGSYGYQYNTIFARATSAQYADLAELYLADAEYPVGTVVMIGGNAEVTACQFGNRAVGAVSENPSYLMNSGLEGGTKVALKGRVPVQVVGVVKKGQNLIAGSNGCATVSVYHSSEVFAIALESSDNTGEKLVEALIL